MDMSPRFPWPGFKDTLMLRQSCLVQERLLGMLYVLLFVERPSFVIYRTPPRRFWSSELASARPTVQYKDVMGSDEGLAQWLEHIVRLG